MKHIFILLILFPVITFSQEITDIKDNFKWKNILGK